MKGWNHFECFKNLKNQHKRRRLHGDEAGFVHNDVSHMPITCVPTKTQNETINVSNERTTKACE